VIFWWILCGLLVYFHRFGVLYQEKNLPFFTACLFPRFPRLRNASICIRSSAVLSDLANVQVRDLQQISVTEHSSKFPERFRLKDLAKNLKSWPSGHRVHFKSRRHGFESWTLLN
jgi:hypothetical protein